MTEYSLTRNANQLAGSVRSADPTDAGGETKSDKDRAVAKAVARAARRKSRSKFQLRWIHGDDASLAEYDRLVAQVWPRPWEENGFEWMVGVRTDNDPSVIAPLYLSAAPGRTTAMKMAARTLRKCCVNGRNPYRITIENV